MQHSDAEAVAVFAFKFRGYWLCSTSRCSSATSSLSPLSQAETPSELFFCVYSPALIENTIRLVATSPPGIQCLRLVSHKMGTAEGLNEVQEVQEVGSCYFNGRAVKDREVVRETKRKEWFPECRLLLSIPLCYSSCCSFCFAMSF